LTEKPPLESLAGKNILITGASRGIGAETANVLGAAGATVIVNYRSKSVRAERVASAIRATGGSAITVAADISEPAQVSQLFAGLAGQIDGLDVLILNASGGLEEGVDPDYAMRLNRDAQRDVLQKALPIMRTGGRVVFLTSHQAHFVHSNDTMPEYLPVATSKRAGEDELRSMIPELTDLGIDFVVVSGDLIEGTITATLLERANPEAIKAKRDGPVRLYNVVEFAEHVAAATVEPIPEGNTRYVGDTRLFAR
jgi:NAD(P)-dependent dehydrogenase (short-subunit alcohol dehydrogenase family)